MSCLGSNFDVLLGMWHFMVFKCNNLWLITDAMMDHYIARGSVFICSCINNWILLKFYIFCILSLWTWTSSMILALEHECRLVFELADMATHAVTEHVIQFIL